MLILVSKLGNSQEDTPIFKTNGQFIIGVNPFFMNKPKFNNNGDKRLEGFHALSGEVYAKYHLPISEIWSIRTGLGIGLTPMTTKFSVENNGQGNLSKDNWEYIDDRAYHFTELPGFYSNFSFGLEGKIKSFENGYLFASLDIQVYWYLAKLDEYSHTVEFHNSSDIGDITPLTPTAIFYTEFKDGKYNTLNASLQLSLGYGLMLRNNHQLRFSIAWNISPFERYSGSYYFKDMGFDSKGTYTYGISNFGAKIEWMIGKKINAHNSK